MPSRISVDRLIIRHECCNTFIQSTPPLTYHLRPQIGILVLQVLQMRRDRVQGSPLRWRARPRARGCNRGAREAEKKRRRRRELPMVVSGRPFG